MLIFFRSRQTTVPLRIAQTSWDVAMSASWSRAAKPTDAPGDYVSPRATSALSSISLGSFSQPVQIFGPRSRKQPVENDLSTVCSLLRNQGGQDYVPRYAL